MPVVTIPECPMTPGEAARLLGVSTTRVRQLIDAGALVGVVTPLGRVIDAGSVEKLAVARAERRSEKTNREQ